MRTPSATMRNKLKPQKRSLMESPILPILPPEIIHEILSRLPTKSLLQFRSVCKPWKALISDPGFIYSQHNQAKNSPQQQKIMFMNEYGISFRIAASDSKSKTLVENVYFPVLRDTWIVCSCESLILLKNDLANGEFILWNPSLRTYTQFSRPDWRSSHSRIGLCYDSATDEYKVVVVGTIEKYYVCYSLKSDSWTEPKEHPYSRISLFPSVFVNKTLHWGGSLAQDPELSREIITFDPNRETFKRLAKPELVADNCEFYLMALRGFLGLFCHTSIGRVEIWLKTGHDNEPTCWSPFMVISNKLSTGMTFNGLRPVCSVQEYQILFVDLLGLFFFYDLKEEKLHELKFPYSHPLMVVSCLDSLLLPGAGRNSQRVWLKSETV